MPLATDRWTRYHAFPDFDMLSVKGATGQAIEVASLTRACNRICGDGFANGAIGIGASLAKRSGSSLPCGHWMFCHKYRSTLDLCNAEDPQAPSWAVKCAPWA